MTSLEPAAPPALQGNQRPRICHVPDFVSSTGQEAIELAASAGLYLDPWEAFVLDRALGERADHTWSAFEVGLVVPRQNGKGAILEARELAGLFLLGERMIIHSAHQFDTSLEAFRRLENLIQDTPELHKRVKPRGYKHSHGEEGIELRSGQRIRFRTRTKGGGRGFTGDCLLLDEAMILPESFHGALLPTLSARSILGNPQVWYTGSAVDQIIHEDGRVLARIRRRGLAGADPRLAFFEWSLGEDTPDDVDPALVLDENAWAQANPGLGIRISAEHVASEQRSMDARTFAVERLGVGDWPSDDDTGSVISIEMWEDRGDEGSQVIDPVCFAFDVAPDRSWASIGVSGRRSDGLYHLEVVDRQRGTGWIPGRLKDLTEAHDTFVVVCAGRGPAASLIHEIQQLLGVDVLVLTEDEHAKACGFLYDAVVEGTVKHRGTPELASAVKGASTKPLGDSWAWSRKNSAVDITPLVACTFALWGASTMPKKPKPIVVVV